MTEYQKFCRKWAKGCGSAACAGAGKVVFARGRVPCEVLFVGEAPGESENALGVPFVGPAGKLQDSIVARATRQAGREFSCGYANLVCCIPREGDGGKAAEPEHDQIMQCQARLEEFIRLCNPRLIVRVGKLAREYLDRGYKHSARVGKDVRMIDLVHPAAILRANVAQQGLMVQRSVVTLAGALEDLNEEGS